MLLSPKQTSLLNQVSQKIQSKTFDIYTAVLGVLLFRLLPNIKHVLIGIDANRSDLSWDKPMGCVLNTLPIRLDRPETNTKLGPFLGKVRDAINGVLEHSSVPFDVLVNELKLDRSANCSPVFQVMIQHRIESQDRVTWCNATRSRGKSLKPCTGFDLHLEIVENAEGNSVVSLEMQQGLYSQEHTDLLVKTYVNLLEQLTTIPEAPLETAELWSSEVTSMALRVATGMQTHFLLHVSSFRLTVSL